MSGSFGIEVSKGLVGKVILAISGFIGSIIIARHIGPVAYGTFHLILAIVNFADNPINGVGVACKKRISESNAEVENIVSAGISVSLIGGVMAIGTAILFQKSIQNYINVENGVVYIVLLFCVTSLFKVIQLMVSGIGGFGTSVLIDGVRSVITIPLQVILVLLGFGVGGLVFGSVVSTFFTIPLLLFILKVRPEIPTKDTFQSLWSYAKFSIPSSFVGVAYDRLDILLIGTIVGTGASGHYKVAMNLVIPATFLSGIMSSGLFTEVSTLVSKDEEVKERVETNISFASFFAVPIFFGALAMPQSIVATAYGGEYLDAGGYLIGLALFQVFSSQTEQTTSIISGYDKPNLNLTTMAITLTVNIVLGVFLINKVGAIGAIIATIVAEAVKYALTTYFAKKLVDYTVLPTSLYSQFFSGLIMFAVVEVLHQWITVSSFIDLLLLVGTGAVIYGVVLISISDLYQNTAKSIYKDLRNEIVF